MKINLIGNCFDENSGQGIYRYSGELLKELKKTKNTLLINSDGDINHIQQPELIWGSLFKKNVITTVHDIIPLVYGERKFLFRIFFYLSILITVIKSKKIIAVSECTKKDLIKYFLFSKKKIKVIYEGVSKNFYPIKKKPNKIFTIGYVGGLGKRKKVEVILRVAKELPEINFKIGGKGPQKERLKNLTNEMKLNNVQFVGFIPDKKMNEFYNSLDLFIFPSLYEGFGLPVLEAMACGVPVITSNRSSLPEIIGEAGILVNPKNVDEITKTIKKVLKDKKLQNKMKSEGLKQAKKFNWEKTARETLKIYGSN